MGNLFKKTPSPKQDLTKADYRQAVEERTAAARNAQLGLLKQLEQQTGGQGPSLANAEMRAATNKNLGQLLAATAATRGASGKAALASQAGSVGRELAGEAGKARSQEMEGMRALRAQTGLSQQAQDLAQVMEPGKLLAQAELQRYEADVARQRQVRESQAAMRGALTAGVGRIIGGMMGGGDKGTAGPPEPGPGGAPQPYFGSNMYSDERQKQDVKSASKEVSSFLDAISKQNYKPKTSYKDIVDAKKRMK